MTKVGATAVGTDAARVSGEWAVDPAWIRDRVDQLARAWLIALPADTETRRVAGTLWFSMSVYSLLTGPIDAVVAGHAVPDPAPERVVALLTPEGALGRVHHAALCTDVGQAIRDALEAMIAPVAAVSGASVPSLWAIASDALANRALESGGRLRAQEVTDQLADDIGHPLPRPRFTTVAGRTFVRRTSCCLYYVSPLSDGKCTSCPRRAPSQRRDLLAALVAADRRQPL